MCGIAGLLSLRGVSADKDLVNRMVSCMSYRGPDSKGLYSDGPVGLGHQRLSILDLSSAGHQPMPSQSGQSVIVYNGEVYNFRELRRELELLGSTFRSQSDTEVVLEAYERWGDGCVSRFNGMFAFAIWSPKKRRLFLARDRFGVKPLYWYFKDGLFLFASEVKAILRHHDVSRSVNVFALDEYFSFQNIFTDRTLFENIRLLPPACTLTLDVSASGSPKQARYWDYPFDQERLKISEDEAVETLYDLFEKAVNRQLVSDVPVGAYLSGGMDSGAIVAVARKSLGRLSTFTGGFDLSSASGLELGCDERAASEVMSNLLKTEHYEIVLHAGDMEEAMPNLIWHLEDLRVGQCYPNYYVARLASKFVKVVISGAGGDELFGGYPWRYSRGMTSRNADDFFNNYYAFWQRLVPDEQKPNLFNHSVRSALGEWSTFDVFRGVFSGTSLPLETPENFLDASLYFELKTFLHGLLVVEDKLSMAHILETRVRFLDNDLVDFACRLPSAYKVNTVAQNQPIDEDDVRKYSPALRTGAGKTVLRKAMQRLMPTEVTTRVKQGFSAPDASWFRGESIDYINTLLRDRKAKIYDFLQYDFVISILEAHCANKVNHRLLIWSFLSFEWWCRKFLDPKEGHD